MPSEALRIATLPEGLPVGDVDLARELAVSVKTIRRLDQSGRLPRPTVTSTGQRTR